MSVTRLAVHRPIGTSILYAAVLLVGAVAVDQLAVDLLPQVDFPRISVVTQYEGIGPEEIETLITRPIERTVATVDGVEQIEAESAEGLSRVQLHFAWGTDLNAAVADVRSQLDRLGNVLPEDATRPVVYKFDLASIPIASLGLSGRGDPRRLRFLADEVITRRLEHVAGVAAVDVNGGRVREVRVALDAARLIALNVSANEVVAALAPDNKNVSAGDMDTLGDKEMLVRAVGEWETAEEVGATFVADRDGRAVYVRDVADVVDGFEEVRSERWVDGVPGITMRVSKQSGANTVAAVEGLIEEIAHINEDYEGRLHLVMLSNAGDYIEDAVTNVETSALFGAGLAVLVLLVFLRDLRTTALIAVAIPLSIVATFALMFFSGFTLNIVSFGGLALGIGMLVDNAIVVLESVQRKRETGAGRLEAALEGTREVAPAVIAGTLTTVAVFAPVVFLGGFAGIFFKEMAAVVAFSLGCSLAVALTLVPSWMARFRRKRGAAAVGAPGGDHLGAGALPEATSRYERAYEGLLKRALGAPWLVVAIALVALFASVRLVDEVGVELMPETDEGLVDLDFELPVGTPVAQTTKVVKRFERRIGAVLKEDELESMLTSAGPENWWRPGGGHEGEVEVNLSRKSERERGIDAILADVRRVTSGVPGASVRVRQRSQNPLMRLMRGRSGERLTVEIRGHDLETAAALGAKVKAALEAIAGVTDVRVDREEGLEEKTIHVDRARAADVGLTRTQVADTLETYVLGHIASRMRDGAEEVGVRVVLRDEDREDVAQLAELPVMTPTGPVPLEAVARFGERRGPSSIQREGQERVLAVVGGVAPDRALNEVIADVDAAIRGIERPAGFTIAVAGEVEEQQDTFRGLLIGIILAILLVYAVMAVQFESLRHPLVVMAALPFGFIGVVLTLLVTGTTFSMNAFLGAIVLVGIAVNNAIVLVDYANLLRREQGYALLPAIIAAGRRRLRPILMTTLTTVLAMLPLALAVGEGSEIQAPLARVVLGGLLMSTLVTLVIVPCLYLLVERGREARRVAASAEVGGLGATAG
ncbi:MAG: efflux RND transporter permease subunit [Myxococcales bacterium]|nr:efflux RND transporter permease subunit [Myxococcales bacterium]MCB9731734.1 efflux RND transporter permease subunit [Deltaproteobacteria bacterium]